MEKKRTVRGIELPKLTQQMAMKFAGLKKDIMFYYDPDEKQARRILSSIIEKSGSKNMSFVLATEMSKEYSSKEVIDFIALAKKFVK